MTTKWRKSIKRYEEIEESTLNWKAYLSCQLDEIERLVMCLHKFNWTDILCKPVIFFWKKWKYFKRIGIETSANDFFLYKIAELQVRLLTIFTWQYFSIYLYLGTVSDTKSLVSKLCKIHFMKVTFTKIFEITNYLFLPGCKIQV